MHEQFSLFDPAHTPTGRAIAEAGSELPPIAQEMIKVMGEPATMALIGEMGGLRLIVPGWPLKRASSRYQRLEEVVGPEAAQAFAARWGNIEVQVPLVKKAKQLMRDRAIVEAYSSGKTKPADLARQHNLSEGQVWRILKRDTRHRDEPTP